MNNERWILQNPLVYGDEFEKALTDDPSCLGYVKDEDFYDMMTAVPGITLGDEISTDEPEQYGIVVGIIRNRRGVAECYKVAGYYMNNSGLEEGEFGFDYIQAVNVVLREMCGSSAWSLDRIGYKWVKDEDYVHGGYFYSEETGDIAHW